MSYEPTVWSPGDTVTATKLNKIEEGIVEAASTGGGGGLLVNATFTLPGFDPSPNDDSQPVE